MWVYQRVNSEEVSCLDQPQGKGVMRMAEPPGFEPPGFADGLNMGSWDVRERVLDDYDCGVFAWSARPTESPLIGAEDQEDICSELSCADGQDFPKGI